MDLGPAIWAVLYNNHTIDPNMGCWLYTGEIDSGTGYGRVMIEGYRFHTHRLSAALHLGLDLNNPNQFACHIKECPNRHCWNPNHLYVGDNQSNQLDVIVDKCKKGHDLVGNNIVWNRRPNGQYHRLCRICHNERGRRNRKLHKDNVLNIDRKVG